MAEHSGDVSRMCMFLWHTHKLWVITPLRMTASPHDSPTPTLWKCPSGHAIAEHSGDLWHTRMQSWHSHRVSTNPKHGRHPVQELCRPGGLRLTTCPCVLVRRSWGRSTAQQARSMRAPWATHTGAPGAWQTGAWTTLLWRGERACTYVRTLCVCVCRHKKPCYCIIHVCMHAWMSVYHNS